MKIAQFREVSHGLTKVLAEDDVTSTLPMFTRVSEWVEVDFPQLPPADYRLRQIQALDREEQELREKLSRVSQVRAKLQPDQPEAEHGR